jgi:hypothetical protein
MLRSFSTARVDEQEQGRSVLLSRMAALDDQVQPWRLAPAGAQLQKLRSLSAQQAIVPLQRVSSTLEEHVSNVKRNSQLLLTTAQTALQNGLGADDLQLLKRLGASSDTSTRSPPAMRRVASDTNFLQHTPGRLRLQRPPTTAQQQQGLTREQQQRQADAWDWLSALNSTLNQARAAQQSRFQLTRTGLEEQVRCGSECCEMGACCGCLSLSYRQNWCLGRL